jgi:hypothetical protein
MVLRLATTMDLPLRQQNALLLAAGYAPAWDERGLSARGLEVVNRALDYMLAQHELSIGVGTCCAPTAVLRG